MKGLWILGGLAAAVALLAWTLTRESSADLERIFEDAVRDRPAVESALEECGDLVRYFAEMKPTERKKGELEELRRRTAQLEGATASARDSAAPRDERKRELTQLGEQWWSLKRDVEDLRARLREMKSFELELRPRVAGLGDRLQRLYAAQGDRSDPEFQQRADALIKDGKDARVRGERALQELSVKIGQGRVLGMAALHDLDDVLAKIDELLAAPAADGG